MTDSQRKTPRRYDEAFRAAAVERAAVPGASITATAAELGISPSTLRRWVRAQHEAETTGPPDVAVAPTAAAPELKTEPAPERSPDSPPEREAGSESPLRGSEPEGPEADASEPPRRAEHRSPPAPPSEADRAPHLHVDPEAEWHIAPGHEAQKSVLLPSDDIFPALARLIPAYRFPILLVALGAAVLLSTIVPADYPGRSVIVAVHVVSLVVSFGAVLLIDWHGLLWLFGLRHLGESTRLAAAAGPLIWAGLAGLIASGAFLGPDLASPLTVLKMVLVLAVAWNGAAMSVFRRRLARLPPDTKPSELPRTDWRVLAVSSTISQIGWWGAIVIGFINSGRR